MITRIFIDNYRCFSNFEYRPGDLQLILGENGSGKTSLFEVLRSLRSLVRDGATTEEAFPTTSLSAWGDGTVQVLELDIAGDGGEYRYHLSLEHDRATRRSRIQRETLTFDGRVLCSFDGNTARLSGERAAMQLLANGERSPLSNAPRRSGYERLDSFLDLMTAIWVFCPDPRRMDAHSLEEQAAPAQYLQNLVSWLRHLWQEQASFGAALLQQLKEVLEGLENVRFERVSRTVRELQCDFRFPGANGEADRTLRLPFDALSDGQRMLVALYAILLAGVNEKTTLCIDEPDNFLALREIQPWLMALSNAVQDRSGQCLLISHHPELIDFFATKRAVVFRRDPSGPIRVSPFEWTKKDDVLNASELVARGWK